MNNSQDEDSPEQIEARLRRYRDSLLGAPAVEVPPADPTPWFSHLVAILDIPGGIVLAALTCGLVVALARVDVVLALGIATAMTVIGLLGVVWRVPFSLWWTLGVVVGAALARFS